MSACSSGVHKSMSAFRGEVSGGRDFFKRNREREGGRSEVGNQKLEMGGDYAMASSDGGGGGG